MPQGSVLGPLLFIMYINDLPTCSVFNCTLYADVTYLSMSHENLETLQCMVNDEIIKIDNWMHLNKLTLNYSKSVYMITGCHKRSKETLDLEDFQIILNGIKLQQASSVKYLGIFIDRNLNWSSHVASLKSKLACCAQILYKLRCLVSIDILKVLYFSFAYCHLQYCVVSWGHTNHSVLQSLNVLHNNLLRIMTFSRYTCHVTPLYKNLQLLKLTDIYNLELAKLMHKFHYGMLPATYNNLFQLTSQIHSHFTRLSNSSNYFIPRYSSNAGKMSISYRGSILWTEISQEHKMLSFYAFKKCYKVLLLSQYAL